MNLSSLPITPEMFTQYANYAVIGIMVLCALIGFARGTFKSVYYMIATLVVFIGGFLLMSTITELLINIDISSANQTYQIDGVTYNITTVKEAIVNIVQLKLFGGADVSDTVTLTIVVSVAEMLVKIVYAIILIVVAFTVFKLIADIIWLIVKPSKTKKVKEKVKDKKGKEKIKVREEKKKVSFLSRLLGAGIGAAKGLLYTLLIFFLVAGIASIAESVNMLNTTDGSTTYNVVVMDDTLTLVSYTKTAEEGSGSQSISDMIKQYQEYLDLAMAYRDTIPGKVFGSVKVDETSLDEYVFDAIISANGKNDNIEFNFKLRKELQKVVTALSKCPELLNGSLSLDSLSSMDKDKLREVVDILSDLELVKVVMPVALEVVVIGNLFDDKLPEDLRDVIKGLDINEIKDLDFTADVKNIGYMFIDITSILQTDENGQIKFDFINIPKDVVNGIFEKIGDLNVVDVFAPIAVSYVLSMQTVKDKFTELGIDMDSLGLDKIEDWGEEITQLGKIYGAFCDLGLTAEDISNMDLSKVEMDKVDALTEAIFDSLIITNALPVVVDYAMSILPEDYKGVITIPTDVNWKNELTPLLKATVTLLSCGLLDTTNPEETVVDKLAKITNEDIEKLGEYLSSSSIIRENLNGLIDVLMKPDESGNSPLNGITLSGLDSADDWNKQEISSLFKAVKDVLNSGIMSAGDDYLAVVKELSNETVDSLADDLSNSLFFRRNFSSIITYLMDTLTKDDDSLALVSLSENEWTRGELQSILFTIREIAKSDIVTSEGTDGIKNLSDPTIYSLGNYISESKFFTRNLTPLMDWMLKTVDMGNIKIVGFENSEDWTRAEIISLLKSARLIVTYQDDLTQLINMSEDELDTLMSSKLISTVLVDFIKEYTKEGSQLEIVKGVDLIETSEWNDIYKENIGYAYTDGVLTIQSPSGFDVDKYYIYVFSEETGEYEKVGSTDGLTFDFHTILSSAGKQNGKSKVIKTLPEASNIRVKALNFGEIRNMFIAVQTIIGEVSGTIDGNKILANLTNITESDIVKVLKSRVICETLISQIENYATGDSAFISIPEGDLTKLNADGSKDRSAWLEGKGTHGELYKALKAITVVFKGVDFSGEITFDTNLITGISDSDVETIVDSAIINETLIFQVEKFATGDSPIIYIPTELKTVDGKINRTTWNEAEETYNILSALKTVFSGGSIDSSNLKLKPIIDGKDNILKSLVLIETVKQNIIKVDGIDIPTGESLSLTTLDGWKNTYNASGEATSYGEVNAILNAVSLILDLNDDTTIDSINVNNIKIGNIITKSDEVLKSLIISETVRVKLMSVSGIDIPTGEGLSTTDLTGWKNTYNSDGTVNTRGEINNLLQAINCVLNFDENTDISTISADSIKLGGIITNKDTVLKSLVISETVRVKITSISTINVPENEGLSLTSLDGWKNTYKADGSLETEGEIGRLLTAINQVLNFDDSTSLESINADTIKIGNVITKSDEILKSLVISETVRVKLMSVSGIDVPTGEGLSTTDLTGWKNTYNADGTVNTKGEISNLLSAINCVLNFTDDTDISTISADTIKLGGIITNKETVLKSLVISETIRVKLTSISTINVPINEGLSTSGLTGWKNTYKADGTVDAEGEISRLLTSINAILNFDDSTSFESINADTIKIQNVILESDQVLKSLVISETIRVKLTSISGISVPSGEGLSSVDLVGWKNTYKADGSVETKGEISNLLGAINIVIGVDDSTTLTSFNMNGISLKNIIDNSDSLLKSLVLAETIRTKITGNSVVTVPTSSTLSTTSLSGWKNIYNSDGYVTSRGELSYLLSALGVIINPSDSTGLDGFSMSINLGTIIGERDALLHSEIISATVKKQIVDMAEKAGAVISLPQHYNDTSSANYITWYNVYSDTYNETTHKVESSVTSRGEVDAMLAGVGSLLGSTDTTLDGISSFNFSAIFDPTSQAVIINSKVISETIITKLEGMSATLKIPTGKGFDNQADRTNWWNTETGELKYFLTGVSSLLSDEQKENLSSISLGVDGVFSSLTNETSRTKLLQSYVISETLTVNFAGLSILSMPTEANCGVDLKLTSSHDSWYIINSDRTIEEKELWNLIASIKYLVGDSFDSSVSFTIDSLLANPAFVPTLDADKNNTNENVGTFLKSKMIEEVFIGLVKNIVVDGAMKDSLNVPTGGYNWYYKQYEESTVIGKEYDLRTILESIYMMTNAGLGYDMSFDLASLDTDKLSDAYVISRTFRGSIAKTFNGLFETSYNYAYAASVYKGSPIDPWATVMFVQSEFDAPKTRLEAQTLLSSKITTIRTNIESVSA